MPSGSTVTGHETSPGELPEGWETKTLGDLVSDKADIVDGPFGSNLKSAHYTDSGARVIRLQNIGFGEFREADAFISLDHYATLEKHNVSQGDLLFSSLGENLPRACLTPDLGGPAIVKADCIRVRLSDSVNSRFVLHSTQRPEANSWANEQMHGMGRPRLGLGKIRGFPVPFPPEAEQERIVEVLETQLSRLDAALEHVQTLREKAAQFRRSLLHAAFTGALTGHDSSTGELPDGWSLCLLDEVNDPDRPICYGILKPGPDTPGGIPYVKVKNIKFERVLLDGLQRTTPEIEAKYARSRLRTGDLLVSIRGTYGRTAVVPSELEGGNITQDSARIAPVGIDSRFVFRYLQSPPAQDFFRSVARGVAVKGVNIRDLRQLPVPVPGPGEQERIVEALEEQLSRLDAALAVADEVEERASALRRSLLHAAFTGKLTEKWREENRV